MRASMSRNASVAAGIASAFVLGMLAEPACSSLRTAKRFDAQAWVEDTGGLQTRRHESMPALLESRELFGMNERQLTRRLGPPMHPAAAGTVDTAPLFRDWDLVYSAGCQGMAGSWLDRFGADCGYLCLDLDDGGQVRTVAWIQDG